MPHFSRFLYIEQSHRLLPLVLLPAIAAPAAAVAQPANTPALHLLKREPVSVRGRSFHAAERVKVRLSVQTTGTKRLRLVTAGPAGGFTAVFQNVGVGRCTAFSVVAIGNEGSSARLKILPLPSCLPA
jgi:hypothetical protein